MIRTLSQLWSRSDSRRTERTGFVYTPNKEPGPLTLAKAGDVVSTKESAPPWIVVDHSKDSIVFTDWPGLLWLVEVVEPAPRSEQITDAYTRAKAVRLIETSSTTELFGPHGNAVEKILDRAAQLRVADVDAAPPPRCEAHDSYSNAWNKWLSIHSGDTPYLATDHSGTLGVGPRTYESPIGRGFVLLFNVVNKRAGELEGDSAFVVDSEGEIDFATKWNNAFTIAKHAAMAYGAPELLSEVERHLLADAWDDWLPIG